MATERSTELARGLRRNATDVEAKLWQRLRGRQIEGVKFVRQFPVGPYIADFACRSAKLVIELDGGQHADNMADVERTRVIEAHGYTVLRFWNTDVAANMEGVLDEIARTLHIAR